MRDYDPGYKETLDNLVHLGYIRIFSPEKKAEEAETLSLLRVLVHSENFSQEMQDGLAALACEVEIAKAYISTEEFLRFSLGLGDTESYEYANFSERHWDCYEMFDDLICAQQAVLDLKQELAPLKEFYAELESAVDKLIEWFTIEFNAYRLVPFNEFRLNCLKRIPENIRYLFPWYEDCSDENPEFFFGVIFEELLKKASPEYALARAQIMTDPLLRNIFVSWLNDIKLIFAVIENNPQFGFFSALRSIGSFLAVPTHIMQVGFLRICYYTLMDLKASSEVDALILGSACAPIREDKIRLNFLKNVFQILKDLPNSNLKNLLQKYLQNRDKAEEVAREFYSIWTDLCNHKTDQILSQDEIIVREEEDDAFFRTRINEEISGLVNKFKGC